MNAALCVFAVGQSGCLERELKPLTPCLVSGVSRKVLVNDIDKLDLLFVIDNSNSMQQEQQALREQLPRLIQTLTTGQRSPNDPRPFTPINDLHVGVVSSDMGTPGVSGNRGCGPDGGDDGKLQHDPHGSGCAASYPSFLAFNAAHGDDASHFAQDVGCIAVLGTGGCGLEQQLEAPLKALWPSQYVDAKGNIVPDNPIRFLSTTVQGTFGRGDIPLAQDGSFGFQRNDVSKGQALLAIVVVTDEEDCSSRLPDHLVPKPNLDASSPYYAQPMNLRCHYNPQNLYAVRDRYLPAFRGLRPGNEELVLFAAIAGVPVRLVDSAARTGVDFRIRAERDAYYDRILSDPDMQERVDTSRPEEDRLLLPSCIRPAKIVGAEPQTAYPPRRIVDLVKAFGPNGMLQSICQDDFGPAVDAIIDLIGDHLTRVCLPRPLVTSATGKVPCDVIWELPPANIRPEGTPIDCNVPFLSPVTGRNSRNARGGNNCVVAQLPVTNRQAPDAGLAGWYYDDFSSEVVHCKRSEPQRVAFTPPAKPPVGVVVRLECLSETQHLASRRDDLNEAVVQPEIGSPCGAESGEAATQSELSCTRTLRDGRLEQGLFCHPEQNVCVQSCMSPTDCPPGWDCDSRPETLAKSARAFCVNPTCTGS